MRRLTLGQRLKELFNRPAGREEWFDDLGDLLVEGDIGAVMAAELIETLQDRLGGVAPTLEVVVSLLRELLREALRVEPLPFHPQQLNLHLVLGVNGVGKTTTIAKLAHHYASHHAARVMLAAGDTFRAAAIDQLAVWGERLGVPVVRQVPGADPGAVIYDALTSARARGVNLVLADTAGRMHTRDQLMRELGKIDKIVRGRIDGGSHCRVLVIDATTGQNALRQAEVFHQAVGVDSVVLAKYDSTAKGGIVVSICRQLGLPFSFMGTGEKVDALEPFDPERFLDALLARE